MVIILYVDDEPDLLEIGKIFLESDAGIQVETISSARLALQRLAIEHYDAILSDYQMPNMNGIEFLKEVRRQYGEIPFILFTGKGREELVIQAINNGADFYVQKGGEVTSQFAELAHHILAAIERRQAIDRLRDSEQHLADIIDFFPNPVFAVDNSGRVIIWNKAMEELTGIPAQEMLGKGDYEYALPFYGERRPVLIDIVRDPGCCTDRAYPTIRRNERSILNAETVATPFNGNPRCFDACASILYNKDRTVAGAIETVIDITDHKRTEARLREVCAKQTEILEKLKEDRKVFRRGTFGCWE